MKKSMRAFGIGIFLAGAAIAGYDQLFPDQQTADTRALEKQIKDYEQQIEDLSKQLAAQEKTADQVATDSEQQTTDNTEQEANESVVAEEDSKQTTTSSSKDVVQATIYIYENVSLYAIGQQAEDLGIVKNGRELELFLAKPEYARSIQKGAFDLRSDMTIEEIATVLTGKKLN